MIVLSYDTSLAACSAAVVEIGSGVHVLSASYCEPGKGHAEILLSMVGDVMSKAQVGFEDIDRQFVTTGPGSFTGVRVALSAARGFRIAHNIPICGLSTMQAISANIFKLESPATCSPIAVIVDARRYESYGQVFDPTLKPLCAPALIAVEDLGNWLDDWKNTPLTLMGTGVDLIEAYGNLLPQNWVTLRDHPLPDAACFARITRDMKPGDVPPDPVYLRKPDAKPQVIGAVGA